MFDFSLFQAIPTTRHSFYIWVYKRTKTDAKTWYFWCETKVFTSRCLDFNQGDWNRHLLPYFDASEVDVSIPYLFLSCCFWSVINSFLVAWANTRISGKDYCVCVMPCCFFTKHIKLIVICLVKLSEQLVPVSFFYISMISWRGYNFIAVCVCVSVSLYQWAQFQPNGRTDLDAVFTKWLHTTLARA